MKKVKDMSPKVVSDKCTKLCNGLTNGESQKISAIDLKNGHKVLSRNIKAKGTPVKL